MGSKALGCRATFPLSTRIWNWRAGDLWVPLNLPEAESYLVSRTHPPILSPMHPFHRYLVTSYLDGAHVTWADWSWHHHASMHPDTSVVDFDPQLPCHWPHLQQALCFFNFCSILHLPYPSRCHSSSPAFSRMSCGKKKKIPNRPPSCYTFPSKYMLHAVSTAVYNLPFQSTFFWRLAE